MSSETFLKNLIHYIAFEVQDRDIPILRTRLVKLLYLSEVEAYRRLRKRLTEIDWIRYKYGPFSFDIQEATKGLGFDLGEESIDFESGSGVRYEASEPQNIDEWLPLHIKGIVDRVINRWADEDLNALLDYVYIETEPMAEAEFGDRLEFSNIDPNRRPKATAAPQLLQVQLDEIRQMATEYSASGARETAGPESTDASPTVMASEAGREINTISGSVRSTGEEVSTYEVGRD